MAAKPTTTAEQREEIIESLKAGVVPSVIAAKLKLTYESVRWIGVKNVACRRERKMCHVRREV